MTQHIIGYAYLPVSVRVSMRKAKTTYIHVLLRELSLEDMAQCYGGLFQQFNKENFSFTCKAAWIWF